MIAQFYLVFKVSRNFVLNCIFILFIFGEDYVTMLFWIQDIHGPALNLLDIGRVPVVTYTLYRKREV